jgi:serine/threonine protein phosphatase PrpC
MMKINFYSFSGKGMRNENEDFVGHFTFENNRFLYLIADGMGGYGNGEIASKLVVESIVEYISMHSKEDPVELFKNAIHFANEQTLIKRNEFSSKLGATIGGIFISNNEILGAWLGDVRIYQVRDKKIIFESEDHSLINQLKKRSVVSTKDIDRYKHIVTQSLSGNSIRELPVEEFEFLLHDIFIICSDGLWETVNINEIVELDDTALEEYLKNNDQFKDNYSLVKLELS